jgi:Family of unknown function (DUF6502)
MSANLAKRLERDYSRVLTTLFAFMLRSGVKPEQLQAVCTSSLGKAERKASLGGKEEPYGLANVSRVLYAWHRDRRYLDDDAAPRPIRLLGPSPSVEALIRSQRCGVDAAQVARDLKALRLVEQRGGRGLYRPRSDAAVISRHDPLVLQHATRALSSLLETVAKNMSTWASTPLIERSAEVPDLPTDQVESFRRFSQLQGWVLIRTVNDWLESRRPRRSVRKRTGSTVRAGVHLHAYVEKMHRGRSVSP